MIIFLDVSMFSGQKHCSKMVEREQTLIYQGLNDPFYCGQLEYMGVNTKQRRLMVDVCTLHSNKEVMVSQSVQN